MHCALCLPTCPTYALTGLEKSSPRGRIRLIKAVGEGKLSISDDFVEEMNFCLDCQACETACPAGVEYGRIVEAARVHIAEAARESLLSRLLKPVLLKRLFEKPARLRFLASFLKAYQNSGIDSLFKNSRALRIFSDKLHQIQFLVPTVSPQPSIKILSTRHLPVKTAKYKVGLLTGCIMDVAVAETNVDTMKLLVHHRCEVIIPPEQGCCGSLQAHNGDEETARRLARRTVDTFSKLGLDAVIMNSAGCGAYMKQYGEVLSDDQEYAAPAADLAAKVKDLSEFLADIGLNIGQNSQNPFRSKRVTYHDACHLVHAQKISRQPRDLIKSVPDVEYVELPEANWCCGSAGTYNITHFDASMQLLQRKMDNVKSVQPDVIVTSNPGCLIQIQYGLNRDGMKVELLHLATFLRRACGA